MSGKTWVIADTHFGHHGVCKFLRSDGSKLRPWIDPHGMNKAMTENWNSVVHDSDRVYLLGDAVINRHSLKCFTYLKGRKVLVKGNHDIFKLKDYIPYFDDIRAYVVGNTQNGQRYIMSHIPIHPGSLGRFDLNIHGHLHSGVVCHEDGSPDDRYRCVSVEHINYTPLDLNTIIRHKAD